jgi:integrase
MRGHFFQRGKTWTYIIDLPSDQLTGKRKQKKKGGFLTKKKAQEACAIEIAKIAGGGYVEEQKDYTLEGYLHFWLKTYAKPKYKPTSYETAETMFERRIIPELGSIRLSKLLPVTIEAFYERLSHKYSSEYIRNIHNALRRALRQAYKWDVITRNIMEKVNTPTIQKKEMEFWSYKDWTHFLNVSKDHPHYIFFSLAVRNGMRRGEALGVRWSDIDLERKTLTVRQTVNWTKSGIIFQTPKTNSSERTIELDEYMIQDLRDRRRQIVERRLIYGTTYEDHDLVCCYETGGPVKPKRITEGFDVLTRKAGTKKIRVHDLRHTHASFLLWIGVFPKVAAERLGMSIQMFNERYSHVLPTMQKEAVNKIEEAHANHKNVGV